ncbi:MAG: YggT family protein [Candidatus Neomarinimicrobiota bacterium]
MYGIINLIFQVLYLCLLARVILSWIDHNPYNEIIRWIYKITDPLLRPFQAILPPTSLGIDISPILAFFALGFLRNLIFRMLY